MGKTKERFMELREEEERMSSQPEDIDWEYQKQEELLYEQCDTKRHPLERTEKEKEDEAAAAEYPLLKNIKNY